MAISLASISKGKVMRPPRMIVYGDHKIGKSTFAASAPNCIFIKTEEGLDHIDANSFPLVTTYDDLMEQIGFLVSEKHDFETVALDSLDWLEKVVFEHTCAVGGQPNIEAFGYGKGYMAALPYWHEILSGFNAMRDERGMAIICIAHAHIKRFDAPDLDSYDQYRIKLQDRGSALLQEWADIIAFASDDVYTKKTEVQGGKEITRATSSGKRFLNLIGKPSFQAGNRYNMPAKVPLKWDAFIEAFNKANAPA